MCFSKEVSLGTFIAGTVGGFLCYLTGSPDYKILGIFFMFVSLMQGVEYLLWKHPICDSYNEKLSYIGMILNHLQPIVLALLIYLFNNDVNLNHLLPLVIVYSLVITHYSLKFKKGEEACTMKNKYSHLNWKWNDLDNKTEVYILFLITLFLLGFFFPNKKIGVTFSIFAVLSFVISYFIYNHKGSVGSMWCFFTAFAPYIFLKMKFV